MEIIRLGDTLYDEQSNGWHTLYRHKPTSIMLSKMAEEAASDLCDAIRRKEKFRIRSGGHDVNGYSAADNAIVISRSIMYPSDCRRCLLALTFDPEPTDCQGL